MLYIQNYEMQKCEVIYETGFCSFVEPGVAQSVLTYKFTT